MTNSSHPTSAVLIVEDDCLLRMLTADIVAEAGFVTLQAGNAGEALTILAGRPDVAVMLSGINMSGGMDGLGLARAVSEGWPHIKIIVASGRARLSAADFPANGRSLRKPYHADAMISAIRSMIGIEDRFSSAGQRVYLEV